MTDRLANAQERAIKMMEVTFKQCYQEGYNEGYEIGYKDGQDIEQSKRKSIMVAFRSLEAWEKVREEIKNYDNFILCANGQIGIHIDKAFEIIDKHLKEIEDGQSGQSEIGPLGKAESQ